MVKADDSELLQEAESSTAREVDSPQRSALKVVPVFNDIVADPGQTLKQQIRVENLSPVPLPIKAYTLSFVATDEVGGSDYPDDNAPKSVQHWFSIDKPDFILQSGEIKSTNITISVPKDAEPGGHYATFFYESLIPKEAVSDPTVNLASRIGSLFFFVISGDIHRSGNIARFSTRKLWQHGPIDVTFGFANTGNVHVQPVSTVTITNWRGKTVATLNDLGQVVLPNKTRHWDIQWNKKYAFGLYHAHVVTKYHQDNPPLTKDIQFWVVPYAMIIETLIIIFISLFIFTRGRRRLRKAYKVLRTGYDIV